MPHDLMSFKPKPAEYIFSSVNYLRWNGSIFEIFFFAWVKQISNNLGVTCLI